MFHQKLKVWFSLFSFALCFSHLQAYSIISDLDDTIKITNAGNIIPASYNGVFTRRMFSGVRSFLLASELTRNELFILSASPAILRDKVENLFEENNLKVDQIFLRRNIKEEKFKYKVRIIQKILEASSDEFILLGDDVDKDPEVYQEIKKRFPDRILGIYIRVVRNRTFAGTPFHLIGEVAFREFWSGRLDLISVFHVLQDHQQDSIFRVIPRFAFCPKDLNWGLNCEASLAAECRKIERRIEHHCQIKGKLVYP